MIDQLQNLLRVSIPLIYDESLSYVEFLAALQAKVNEVVTATNTYLSQDLSAIVEAQLDEWLNDGTFAVIIGEDMTVTDAGNYFTATTLVTQLQELGADYVAVDGKLDDAIEDLGAQIAAVELIAGDEILINVRNEGVVGDGSNEHAAVQAALTKAADANGIFYVPKDMTIVVDNLKLANKSNFKIQVDGVLKRKADASYDDPSNRSLLVLDTCTNFEIVRFRGDANVANNGVTIKEHMHVLEIYGCSNVVLGDIYGFNIAGDVIYLQETTDLVCHNLTGVASDTGRNCLSIISGTRLHFDHVSSYHVGTALMPGGVDIEPNNNTDHCRYISFGHVYVEGIGTGIFALSNAFGALCHSVSVDDLVIVKTHHTTPEKVGCYVNHFDDVRINAHIRGSEADGTTANAIGMLINGGNRMDIQVDIVNVKIGVRAGYAAVVANLYHGYIRNCNTYGTKTELKRVNCRGINDRTAIPADGSYWHKGEYIENSTPSILGSEGSRYIIKGWFRVTSGTDNTLNTDWVADKVLTGT